MARGENPDPDNIDPNAPVDEEWDEELLDFDENAEIDLEAEWANDEEDEEDGEDGDENTDPMSAEPSSEQQ